MGYYGFSQEVIPSIQDDFNPRSCSEGGRKILTDEKKRGWRNDCFANWYVLDRRHSRGLWYRTYGRVREM